MHHFEELSRAFMDYFHKPHFPEKPESLYEPARYFLSLGGKRIRPLLCLMGNELFDDIHPNGWDIATAIELFHNFTLIHDDIMDKAPLRRGMPTLHEKFGDANALLAGDVMLVAAYDALNKVSSPSSRKLIHVFNQTAREVCEGQQIDMDFESSASVSLTDYLHMIELKTAVLLAGSLRMGAMIGGAGEGNQEHIAAFGKNLGLAFQIQDDYLDAFGDPSKFGKKTGGDILSNKKTFLSVSALESASPSQKEEILQLMQSNPDDKISRMIRIFKDCQADRQARDFQQVYLDKAYRHLEDIAVLSARKEPLRQLAQSMMQREQ